MKIVAYGTAFTSYEVNGLKQQSKEEIKNEMVSFSKELQQTNELENVSYHTTTFDENLKQTVFRDPVNSKYVVASLENETIEKLKEHFGSGDIIQKEDGTIKLTGRAEAFVSGWFGDIAYKRGFLDADTDHNGQLNEDEYDKTSNNFGIQEFALTESITGTEKLLVGGAKILEEDTYGSSQKAYLSEIGYYRNYRELDIATSLDDELNTTLQIDSDFDGKMSLEEAYSTKADKDAETTILRNLQRWGVSVIPSDIDTKDFDSILTLILDAFFTLSDEEQEKKLNQYIEELHNQTNEYLEENQQNYSSQEVIDVMIQLKKKTYKKEDNIDIYG